ncbi:hypothetical protein H6G27_20130 [Nostoc linckia FACHB-104]|nr:hypothetical protein [Nostoc linckia FACHB-104]
METLAYTHAAVDYEEFNSSSELSVFRNIKIKALKAVKSIAIAAGGITASVVVGTVSLASTNPIRESAVTNGARVVPLHTGFVSDDTKGSVSYLPITSLDKAVLPRQGHMSNIKRKETTKAQAEKTENMQDSSSGKRGYGKLTLVNDTPIGRVIYLMAPWEDQPTRYAYMAACTKRAMKNDYTNGWRYTMDKKTFEKISEVKDGILIARASMLSTKGLARCRTRDERDKKRREVEKVAKWRMDNYTDLREVTNLEDALEASRKGYLATVNVAEYMPQFRNVVKKALTKGTQVPLDDIRNHMNKLKMMFPDLSDGLDKMLEDLVKICKNQMCEVQDVNAAMGMLGQRVQHAFEQLTDLTLAVLGKRRERGDGAEEATKKFKEWLVNWGYADDFDEAVLQGYLKKYLNGECSLHQIADALMQIKTQTSMLHSALRTIEWSKHPMIGEGGRAEGKYAPTLYAEKGSTRELNLPPCNEWAAKSPYDLVVRLRPGKQ